MILLIIYVIWVSMSWSVKLEQNIYLADLFWKIKWITICKRHLWYIKNKSAKIWKQTKCLQTNKWIKMTWYVSVQFSLSDVTPWTTAHQASLSITNSWSLLKLSPLSQWCHSTISSSVILSSSYLQSFPADSNESVLHIRWPKYWKFSFSISPSSEYSWLIWFRIE